MILNQFDWSWAKRILVCGGRDFAHIPKGFFDFNKSIHDYLLLKTSEYKFVFSTLYSLISWSLDPDTEYVQLEDLVIIQGGAKGADHAALEFSREFYPIQNLTYNALWNKYGKAAGPIRNQEMLIDGKPDLVVAFPGGKGTANMIKQATDRKVPTIVITRSTKTTLKPEYDFDFRCFTGE